MKKLLIFCICTLFIFSCKKEISSKKETFLTKNKSFTLIGTLENFYPQKVYLNKIIENSIFAIDSSAVIENKFNFNGFVEYPERFALSFKEYSATVILIIENSTIEIDIDANNIEAPIIKGSNLNSKWNEYQLNSKKIFKKIEYLFPQFQKYRLENNAEKLYEIGSQMKNIEQEYIVYSYNFIKENNNSYLAAMILRDQLKNTEIDTIKIANTYKALSENVKKSPDAEIISLILNLH
jgi:hypothetical protein